MEQVLRNCMLSLIHTFVNNLYIHEFYSNEKEIKRRTPNKHYGVGQDVCPQQIVVRFAASFYVQPAMFLHTNTKLSKQWIKHEKKK